MIISMSMHPDVVAVGSSHLDTWAHQRLQSSLWRKKWWVLLMTQRQCRSREPHVNDTLSETPADIHWPCWRPSCRDRQGRCHCSRHWCHGQWGLMLWHTGCVAAAVVAVGCYSLISFFKVKLLMLTADKMYSAGGMLQQFEWPFLPQKQL